MIVFFVDKETFDQTGSILVVIIVAVLFFFYVGFPIYNYFYPPANSAKAKQEQNKTVKVLEDNKSGYKLQAK